MDPLEDYFDKAKKSLFRFEGLQDYTAMDGEEDVQYFIKNSTLLTRPQDVPWCREMKVKNKNGISTARVRMVARPLNDYTKWELAWHKEASAFSGDDIRVMEEGDLLNMVGEIPPDYWMIDDEYVFLLTYGPRGKYVGSKMVDKSDKKEIKKYVDLKNSLLAKALKISEFSRK